MEKYKKKKSLAVKLNWVITSARFNMCRFSTIFTFQYVQHVAAINDNSDYN